MYILSNAAKNLLRNKGRNILMGVILLAIVVTSGVSIIINTTTGKIIDDYKNRFGVQISISPDLQKMQDAMKAGKTQNLPPITPQQYQAFAKSQYVKEAQLQIEVGANSDSLKGIDQDKQNANQSGSGTATTGGTGAGATGTAGSDSGSAQQNSSGGLSMQAVPMPALHIIGSNTPDVQGDFAKGFRKIISGKMDQNKNECVVSEDFAKLNNLKVGDTVKLKSQAKDGQEFSLVITGIYSDLTPEYGNSIHFPYMNRRNEILTGFDTATQMTDPAQNSVNATYILDKPGDLAAFTQELRSLGLSDVYSVSGDTASYNRIVGPVEGLAKVSLTFLIVVLILGGIILILLSAMMIRERKYEIGVLRAMGMKKGKVALGFLAEMLLITVLCIGIGTAASLAAAQPVSDTLLQRQIQMAGAQSQTNNGAGVLVATPLSQVGKPQEPAIDKVRVSLDLTSFGEIAGVSVLLVLLSSVIITVYITKYEPMKILTERS